MNMLDAIVLLLLVYLALGALFLPLFYGVLLRRLDPAAAGATLGFRLVILPGAVALWPLLLRACLRGQAPRERNAHEDAAAGGSR
jgi:hypothetical protein